MTIYDKMMKDLECRDYLDIPVQETPYLHLIKMRDRLAYYSCQLSPYFYQPPWDLPVVVNDRRYRPVDLRTLQGHGMTTVDYYDLLTDIEAALIEAAARRGITLRKRGKVDDEAGPPPSPQRQRGQRRGGSALGE